LTWEGFDVGRGSDIGVALMRQCVQGGTDAPPTGAESCSYDKFRCNGRYLQKLNKHSDVRRGLKFYEVVEVYIYREIMYACPILRDDEIKLLAYG